MICGMVPQKAKTTVPLVLSFDLESAAETRTERESSESKNTGHIKNHYSASDSHKLKTNTIIFYYNISSPPHVNILLKSTISTP